MGQRLFISCSDCQWVMSSLLLCAHPALRRADLFSVIGSLDPGSVHVPLNDD